MRLRFILRVAVLTIASWGVQCLRGQGSAPQTYSITQDPGFGMGPNVVKVSRDGAREAIEQTMPPGNGRDQEYRSRRLYDFQAHKVYLKILSDPAMACSVEDFPGTAAPPELDPVSGSDALLKELLGDGQMKPAGTETVNGIPAKVMTVTAKDGNGKVWLAQKGNFVVKLAAVGPDGKEQVMIEIKQLSLAKPPASELAAPAGCLSVESSSPIQPSTNVTAVTLQKIANYTGACPAQIKMVGTITTDGPGTVFYQFGGGKMDPGETLTFTAAGTKTVTHTMTFQPTIGNDMGVGAILEAIGTDKAGKHEPGMKGSNNSEFNITCTSGGGK